MNNVLFATFSMWTDGCRMPTNGNLEPLRDFLVKQAKKLILIDQPHPGSDRVMPIIEEYANHHLQPVQHAPTWWMYSLRPFLDLTNNQGTKIIFKIRDFLSVVNLAFRNKVNFDYFIGMESINTLAGLLLKKIGRINKVVYYVLDYSPHRFGPLLNKVYLALDRYCAIHADYVWDVSRAIQSARILAGLDPKKSAPVIHVPIGIYPQQLIFTPVSQRQPYSIAYLGTLSKEQGLDLIIEMMPLILNQYPKATLHIVGGGQENLDRLKNLATFLKISGRVTFYGYVVENIKMAKILSNCVIGVAPYRTFPGSIRQYGDASKLRSYAAVGLPIITTSVPPLGKELQKLGGAIISPDTKEAFAKTVTLLFSDLNLYAKMREVVINFSKKNTWDNEFNKAFSQSQ